MSFVMMVGSFALLFTKFEYIWSEFRTETSLSKAFASQNHLSSVSHFGGRCCWSISGNFEIC